MIMVDLQALFERLNTICREALEAAGNLCISQGCAEVTVPHLMISLLEQPGCDASTVLSRAGVEADGLRQAIGLAPGYINGSHTPLPSFSPLLVELLQEAWLLSSTELQQREVRSGAVLLAALINPSRYLPKEAVRILSEVSRESLRKRYGELLAGTMEASAPQPCEDHAMPVHGPDSALARFGHDFIAQAREGRIDPVLCRDPEIDLMVDILSRHRKNNPIVVGDAGVGKSAVVEGLALRILHGQVPEGLRAVQLWGLDLGALQAGASVKGEFEKRLKSLIEEVKHSSRPIILFIDEAHTLIGAGNSAGESDAANLLKPALARGELRTIAATTWTEYKKYFEKDPALARRFQLVKLEQPDPEAAIHILRGLRSVYEEAHSVYIADDALRAASLLSARYLSGRQLPDKAIDVLDTACARVAANRNGHPRKVATLENEAAQIDAEIDQLSRDVRAGRAPAPKRIEQLRTARSDVDTRITELRGAWELQQSLVDEIVALRSELTAQASTSLLAAKVAHLAELQRDEPLLHADVGAEQIAQVIADWTGIPVTTLNTDQFTRLESLPSTLRERVKGQDGALQAIHQRLLTAVADLRKPGRPMGVFLLVGPSGVGKTETALAVANALFGGERFLTTINMSEYQEKHSVSRLLGAPPGYVGYGEGGVLTEAIRRQPYSVVLLDEVEKAHPEVMNVFYQTFDKGELADGEGRRIDCQNNLFFLTSNLGFDAADAALTDLDDEALRLKLLRFFKPALLARMQVVPYRYLEEDALLQIVDSRLQSLEQRFAVRYDRPLHIADSAREELQARCTRHQNGARMLDASIDAEMLPPLSLAVLQRQASAQPFLRAHLSWSAGVFNAVLDDLEAVHENG